MNEQTIFTAALDHAPDQRAAFLDQACGDDAELHQRVEKLLRLHEQAGDFMDQPAAAIGLTTDQPPLERPGTQIGPYKLLQQIGEGGFGIVFMAEQVEPVRRRVALKVIKPGMDTRQVIARFEGERQALALMDHPNIARVLDGGATESGRPYFVMELVKLRYFAGFTLREAAEVLEVSARKADQIWAYARAWLLAEIGQDLDR